MAFIAGHFCYKKHKFLFRVWLNAKMGTSELCLNKSKLTQFEYLANILETDR